MNADSKEAAFQQDIIDQMVGREGILRWKKGDPQKYDRKLALYTEDCLEYVKTTQPKTWEKYEKLYPANPEQAFIDKLASQLSKVDPHASDKHLRTYGTLGVLRHELRDKSASFKMCQFKPEHGLNPDTLAMYEGNILRVVPELVYSPWTKMENPPLANAQPSQGEDKPKVAKKWRIDLVLFVNGIPVATLELKSEFKQAVENAIRQYKKTRLPKDPETNKPEPLLTFKRGALVHFAVSQYEAAMTTRLDGANTKFLPFNRGTHDGGAGNDVPEDVHEYATGYLWNEVLAPENLLQIIGRFIHLEIKTEEAWDGRKTKKETLIFPRYHQWDLVRKLIQASREEGPGHKYLAQHSAGSGKSNSIAWTAHQLSSLYDDAGDKVFHSVIVVTDRTVLDDQLQDTIYQFEHADGVVGRINRDEGQGSKSEKLAAALESSQPIVIVTIQTFPFVLKAIENSVSLKERCYAIIADEAHSSQSGRTAGKLKEVLSTEATEEEVEISAEDAVAASVEARKGSPNLSYYAFTATPKSKTLELFGRLPHPDQPPNKRDNKPKAFHVYSMRQAIEEGYILDVLQNYTSYKVAYNLAQKVAKPDYEVDAKKAKVRVGQWVRLHDFNIAQKVKVIVEHYRQTVMGLLNGHAKAMVVTGSRKEAVRYKLEFDKYLKKKKYSQLAAMVAFSGEVEFGKDDPNCESLLGEKFSETTMNPDLKGRDMRKAFDSGEFHVMIVAKKFQTGFDQPKLCAMYVDKKLGGLECVQTLSRLNRTYPGKKETYVLDFFNEPDDVLAAFQEYYETATLLDVSDPNKIWDLFDKLRAAGIFLWTEVNQFSEVFYVKSKSNAALSNVCYPARDRWQTRFKEAKQKFESHKELHQHAKKLDDATFIANTEGDMNEAKKEMDALGIFKADLISFSRYYEFMSQIVDYDSTDLEKLNLFALHLAPLLREEAPKEDPIDLSSIDLTHYRLSKIKQQDLQLVKEGAERLDVGTGIGTGKPKSKQEIFLSQLIARLNELFITDGLTDQDLINYAYTIRDKVRENERVMNQIENNSPEQALLGDFAEALDDAVMNSGEVHQNQMTQYLNTPELAAKFQRVIFDLLLAKGA
ncbi:type I restriction endonuclease subunit R [Rhodopirellula europaea]|uniref:Type III restriction protein res subunit n=1 Tax=Rhodopirellula europaea SH398 TaxID=1263868 RepID=M5SAH0_9BACT|nr:DEAD/DEAH box helicase family protein [Rhodopirellula europaea]EMI28470.1 type III restriction protein res subunit [Rhodopirellula europaea SH398]